MDADTFIPALAYCHNALGFVFGRLTETLEEAGNISMLDTVVGKRHNVNAERELLRVLKNLDLDGTVYIGYPVIEAADEPMLIQALLTTLQHSVVAFSFLEETPRPEDMEAVEERQSDVYAALYQKLIHYKPLRDRRELSVPLTVVEISPSSPPKSLEGDARVCTVENLPQILADLTPITQEQFTHLNAAIQRTTNLKPAKKRVGLTSTSSRGAILARIEKEIANLDRWQKKAAIESPAGPQRIRGLAGSGKTVVLALKAAYLHAANPTWDIAITFNTRALHQQFEDLVRRFFYEHARDEPDWEKLRIMHAWGSAVRRSGLYSEIARENEFSIRDFSYGKSRHGATEAFRGVCDELLKELKEIKAKELFDAVLIDEAQDLPKSFFEIVYRSVRQPKRIVWAYDELQNLGSYTMLPPAELFGSDDSGRPFVPDLGGMDEEASRDIILPVCYRNTPWALVAAHALGFGVYSSKGLVQFFDEASLWTDVGYSVVSGSLEPGKNVELKRSEDSTPGYFADLLEEDDALVVKRFKTPDLQLEWVAKEIAKNLSEDELDHTDILIILGDPLTAQKESAKVMKALNKHSISSHLVGVTGSVDQVFKPGSVAITGIYRAKGNEAPMVYAVNSESYINRFVPVTCRNRMFTAITRSRAWVRILGFGDLMKEIEEEVAKVREARYRLKFKVPTNAELEKIRKIHRDKSRGEVEQQKKAEKALFEVFEKLRAGDLAAEDLPDDLRRGLLEMLEVADANDAE